MFSDSLGQKMVDELAEGMEREKRARAHAEPPLRKILVQFDRGMLTVMELAIAIADTMSAAYLAADNDNKEEGNAKW